jgi:serine/threonine protein kinase
VIGKTLSHYKVLEELSRSVMGIVYRALDVKLDREVAVKVLPPELVAEPERKRRFIRESKLNLPHIGMVHEINEAEGVTFIAMELIQGERLDDIINKEKLPLARSLELASEIAKGLARTHDKGIAHRDLKPANIMITEDGHAKAIDFGLAKLVEPIPSHRVLRKSI